MRVRTVTKFTVTRAAPKVAEQRGVSLRQRRNDHAPHTIDLDNPARLDCGTFVRSGMDRVCHREDRFTCNFPSQPKVTETTYRSQMGAALPARIYSADQGQSRYSVTVIDYNQDQPLLKEKAKSCPVGAEPCLGSP